MIFRGKGEVVSPTVGLINQVGRGQQKLRNFGEWEYTNRS